MKTKKSFLGLLAVGILLFSAQSVRQTSEAQVGSWLASQVTENTHLQRGAAAATGVAAGMAGRWAGAKVGALIGSSIAPGIGTAIGAGIGAL
ncbi:hypothetical protein [Flagellimonas onchidii]|uniref:hypothetical protein n=1 Tax=Flagellimonas onchidii TaxID=2562684 RepID=UPI0010A5F8A9|nr:hypothetical protein [Allomuricauda onchidii]